MLLKGLFLFSIFIDSIFPRGRNGVPRSTSSNEPILTVLIGDHTYIIVLKFQRNQKKSNREISLLKSETLLFSKTRIDESFYRGRKRGKKGKFLKKRFSHH